MKKGTLFIIVVLFANNVAAQESIFESINLNVLEQLIELAKQNYPERKIVNRDQAQAKSRLSAARVAHIDVLNVSYFYRPNRRVADPENPFFFAGVQVGLQLSPGQIVRRAFLAKEAKAAYEVAQLKSQAYEVVLENEVKSRYYDYVLSLEQIKNQTLRLQDAEALLEDSRLSFERGEIELSGYISAREDASSADLTLRRAEISFLKARDDLQELIGVDLSTISTLITP